MFQAGALLVLGLAILVLLFALSRLSIRDERLRKEVTEVARGIYDDVVYGYDSYTRRSGAMVHTTRTVRFDCTAVYFANGSTYVCDERLSMEFPKGTNIRILKNGLGEHSIEAA